MKRPCFLRPKKVTDMAMEKDCKVVTTLSGTEYIRALAEDGSTVRIPVSELGKVLAQVMPVATITQNGLMSNSIFSNLMNGRISGKSTDEYTDINQLYKECDFGLTLYILVSAAINSPGVGFLLHFQRTHKSDLSISQVIYQLAFLRVGGCKYRYGTTDGKVMTYSNWIDL